MLINAMATLRGCSPAEIVSESVWQTVGGWQARERDSVLSIVRARFGRLKRSCGASVAESVPEPAAGESMGSEPAEVVITGSRVNPINRMSAISAIHKRTTGDPTDAAISGSYEIEPLTR
jgi:hypothetical protein